MLRTRLYMQSGRQLFQAAARASHPRTLSFLATNNAASRRQVLLFCNNNSSSRSSSSNSEKKDDSAAAAAASPEAATEAAAAAAGEASTSSSSDAAAADSSSNSSSSSSSTNNSDSKAIKTFNFDEYDDFEPEPVTAYEKASYYFRSTLWLGAMAAFVCFTFVTASELFPGRMGPNSLFSEAFEVVRYKDELASMCGDELKAYGRGDGGEGRRNRVDSRSYVADDGSKRTRVRFHVQGTKGKAVVWAEVSSKMAAGEYVYVIIQDRRTGRVVTFEDNRAKIDSELALLGEGGGGGAGSWNLPSFGFGKK